MDAQFLVKDSADDAFDVFCDIKVFVDLRIDLSHLFILNNKKDLVIFDGTAVIDLYFEIKKVFELTTHLAVFLVQYQTKCTAFVMLNDQHHRSRKNIAGNVRCGN